MKLVYIKAGDYYIPALMANEEPEGMLSKYGLMRQNFLREHRSGIYTGMLLEGKLKKHCLMIQEQADERIDVLVSQMAQSEGVDDLRLESPSVDFQKQPVRRPVASEGRASSYAAADNLSEFQKQIDAKTTEAKSARSELVELQHKMKKASELLLYAEQYKDNKPFHDKYKKSKDPDRYLHMHETQLILYDGAERMLRKMGLDPKSVNADEIRADYEAMQARKSVLERSYKTIEKDAKTLQQKYSNVEQYLKADKTQEERQKDQNNPERKSRS